MGGGGRAAPAAHLGPGGQLIAAVGRPGGRKADACRVNVPPMRRAARWPPCGYYPAGRYRTATAAGRPLKRGEGWREHREARTSSLAREAGVGRGALSGMAAREMPRRRAERRVTLWQRCCGSVRDECVAWGTVGATGGCDGRRQRPRRRHRRRRRRDRAHRRRRGLCRRCRGAWLVSWPHGVGHWPHRMHTSLVLRRLYFD